MRLAPDTASLLLNEEGFNRSGYFYGDNKIIAIDAFVPSQLAVVPLETSFKRRRRIELFKDEAELTEVDQLVRYPDGPMEVEAYVDDQFDAVSAGDMVIGFDRISHAELVGEARAAAAFDRETQSCGLVEFQPDGAHTGCRRCGEDYGIGDGGRVSHAAKIGGRCPTGNAAVSRGEGRGFAPRRQGAKIERRRLSHFSSWRLGSCRSVGGKTAARAIRNALWRLGANQPWLRKGMTSEM